VPADSPQALLADEPAQASLDPPRLLADGFRRYERIRGSVRTSQGDLVTVERDVLRGGRVVCVLPLDLSRGEIVLIRQFRLPGQLAIGRGSMIELVAGRVEDGEDVADAARRECLEEIGVAPYRLVPLLELLATPGLTDETISLFLAEIDAAAVPERSGLAEEHEDIEPLRIDIDRAVAALDRPAIHNGPVIIALQWLALNRARLAEILGGAPR
jgi:ADP-ribose pyrophosphatase